MNTRLWRGVRRSHTPWRIFGYFLCEQKVTSVSITEPVPQGGTFSIKKVGATQNVTPTKISLTGAEGKQSFPQSFFAYFFLRKSRLPADDVFRNLPQRLSGLHIKALAAGQVGQRDDAHQLSSLHHRQAAHLLAGHELGGGPAIVLG